MLNYIFPIVALSNKDNLNLTKQLSNEFKRSVYRNSYQTIPANVLNQGANIYDLLSALFQVVKRLLVLAYAITANAAGRDTSMKDNSKYFLPRGKIENCKALIGRRNLYDQPINDVMKQYDEERKVSTRQGDDYTT